MRENSEPRSSSGESWNEAHDKRWTKLFQEFDPKLTDLNNRIISYLLEHGVDNSERLKDLEKEGDDLRDQFDDRVRQEDKSFRQEFDNQYRGMEMTFDDFLTDRGFKGHDERMIQVRRVMDLKPTINDLRNKIEELRREAEPWKRLQLEVNKSGRKYLLNPISDAVYDKESEISGLAGLLEAEVEKIKDACEDYTVEDLEKAELDVEKADEIGFSGNNPNAGRARQQAARARLRTVKNALKQSGKLEKTPEEQLTEELDKLYPNSKSRTIAEYKGKKYQIRYFPLETSRTGKTVLAWGHKWELFSGGQA
jgi:hypothetical protein